jgi:hypothetical protein
MKINAINTINYNNTNKPAFKHVAVPYPEFESAYHKQTYTVEEKLNAILDKISALFTPAVSKEASTIKTGIDTIYETEKQLNTPKNVLSVVA